MASRLQASLTYAREMFAITEAVKKWCQYLLGRRFSIQTNHWSLRSLLHQTIQTPKQQRWLCKLVGYDFDIEYKPGVFNGPTDALSRMNRVTYSALFSKWHPQPVLWDAIRQAYEKDTDTMSLIESISKEPGSHRNFVIWDGLLLFKGRV